MKTYLKFDNLLEIGVILAKRQNKINLGFEDAELYKFQTHDYFLLIILLVMT
jgi:hypothetical protein